MQRLCRMLWLITVLHVACADTLDVLTFYPNGMKGLGRGFSISAAAIVWDTGLVSLLAHLEHAAPELFAIDGVNKMRVFDSLGVQTSSLPLPRGDYFLVPADKQWVWSFVQHGHQVTFDQVDVPSPLDRPVMLESVSLSPRLFYLHNFLQEEEAEVPSTARLLLCRR